MTSSRDGCVNWFSEAFSRRRSVTFRCRSCVVTELVLVTVVARDRFALDVLHGDVRLPTLGEGSVEDAGIDSAQPQPTWAVFIETEVVANFM